MGLSCALWGHHVDNHRFTAAPADRRCGCGATYLAADGSLTRVRHTLSCFLGKHRYTLLTGRDGCREYVCVQCGHPLVYRAAHDPYADSGEFKKKVRYLCGLFGHRVEAVATRDGFVEYACHCGHSFLKPSSTGDRGTKVPRYGSAIIRHPMICVLLGHYIRYVTSRAGYDEFICVNCGHPFCFVSAQTDRPASTAAAAASRSPLRRSSAWSCRDPSAA